MRKEYFRILFRICSVMVLTGALGLLLQGLSISESGPARGSLDRPNACLAGKGNQAALSLLEKLSNIPVKYVNSIKLIYEVTLEREWNVRLKMPATLGFKKSGKSYVSTFRLGEPVGADLWGKFIMLVYGRHTEEYKEMIKEIETTVIERFRFLNGEYVTECLMEILPKRIRSSKEMGFKVSFDYHRDIIIFWKNRAKRNRSSAIQHEGQKGPLTGFFTYIFFRRPETKFRLINIQRVDECSFGKRQRKTEQRPLTSHVIKVGKNDSSKHSDYDFILFLGDESFFDVIHGGNIYFDLATIPGSNLKIPCSIFVEGIINKPKKRKMVRELERLMEERDCLDQKSFEQRRKSIEAINILSAKDVRVRLQAADVAFE